VIRVQVEFAAILANRMNRSNWRELTLATGIWKMTIKIGKRAR
jgi:hypothetical protein